MSGTDSTCLFTNRKEISSEGFLTSLRLLIAVVLLEKLFDEHERLPFWFAESGHHYAPSGSSGYLRGSLSGKICVSAAATAANRPVGLSFGAVLPASSDRAWLGCRLALAPCCC